MPNQNSEEQNDWLYQVDLNEITRTINTPFFLYNQSIIENNLAIVRSICTDQLQISFAVTKNPNPSILRIIDDKCLKFEISDLGELRLALRAGIKPQEIIFTGSMKTKDDMELAVREGVGTIIVEDIDKLQNLMVISTELKWLGSIGIRIDGSSQNKSNDDSSYPLGIHLEDLTTLNDKPNLDLELINTVYLSNFVQQGLDPVLYLDELLTQLKLVLPKFRVIYLSSNEFELEANQLTDILNQIRLKLNVDLIIVELGNRVIKDAGVLVAKIQKLEESDSETKVLIDAEFPSNVEIQQIQIYPSKTHISSDDGGAHEYTKIITLHTRKHRIYKTRELDIQEQDLVIIRLDDNTNNLASRNISLTRILAAELLVSRETISVIRSDTDLTDLYDNAMLTEFQRDGLSK
jgi:diaminopimelate decarboxylase